MFRNQSLCIAESCIAQIWKIVSIQRLCFALFFRALRTSGTNVFLSSSNLQITVSFALFGPQGDFFSSPKSCKLTITPDCTSPTPLECCLVLVSRARDRGLKFWSHSTLIPNQKTFFPFRIIPLAFTTANILIAVLGPQACIC